MMTKGQFERLIAIAAEDGIEVAYAHWRQEVEEAATEAAAADDFRVRAYGYDDDEYVPGCGVDDSFDYRGRPLLSRFNEAGEARW
jgi:hypothetical protein